MASPAEGPSEIQMVLLRSGEILEGKVLQRGDLVQVKLENGFRSFTAADVVIVPEIYFVRDSESAQDLVNQNTLVDRLQARGTKALAADSLEDTVSRLNDVLCGGDLLVVMGAGPVGSVGPSWVHSS